MARGGSLATVFISLKKHNVDFIVIGGIARILHGSEFMTVDVDIVIDDKRTNFKNLVTFAKRQGYRFRIDNKVTKIKNPEDLFLIPFIELVHKKKARIDVFLGEAYDHTKFDYIDWQRKRIGDRYIKVATLDFLIKHSGKRKKDKLRKGELLKIRKSLHTPPK